MGSERRRVELGKLDDLVYKGFIIDRVILDAIVETDKRLLWAFVHKGDEVRAMPYSESEVIWMTEDDVVKEQDVEI